MEPKRNALLTDSLTTAVLCCWSELMQGHTGSLIQLEYPGGKENPLRYLRIWSSPSRGEWDLLGEYSITQAAFGETSIGFTSGTESKGFTSALRAIVPTLPALGLGFELPQRQSLLIRPPAVVSPPATPSA